MPWWLRPCGPGAGSGQAQDVQNSPARPVLADGECYARRTQRPHSCEQRSGRSHPPTTAPQHYARSAQSHDRSIVRLLNRGSCSGRALLAAARSSCFRVNPPPPLSPPVCSWRGEYMCSMYGVPSPRTSSSKKIPNDECTPWASTPRNTAVARADFMCVCVLYMW